MEPEIATVDDLRAMKLALKDSDGSSYTFRRIKRDEYAVCLPAYPPEAASWPEDAESFRKAEQDWITTLPEEQRNARRLAIVQADYKVIALASLVPKLTLDDAMLLGEDAAEFVKHIIAFSKWPEKPKKDAA